MRILSITQKDLQVLLKDRGAVIMLFLVPLLFILVFSGALSSIGQEDTDNRIPLPVADMDSSDESQSLLDGISNAGGIRIETYAPREAEAMLEDGDIDHLLTIPDGYSSALLNNTPVTLRLVAGTNADPEQTEAVRLVVEGVTRDIMLQEQVLASLQQVSVMMANSTEDYQMVFGFDQMQAQAQAQFSGRTEPFISVAERIPALEERESEINIEDISAMSVPGFAVLFAFLAAQTTASSIYDEKKNGSFRRLLASPLSKASMLAGKMLSNLLTALLQLLVIFAFGIWGLPLLGLQGLSLSSNIAALVLVLILIALCSSALGILIAAIARTENQVTGLSTLLIWAMGIVGGSIIPTFILGQFLGPLPRVIPHYWANHALESLTIRGADLAGISTDLLALLGFCVVFFVVGLWRFDYD